MKRDKNWGAMTNPQELRATFDGAAEIYEAARPDYPADLYRDLIDLSGIGPSSELLEIGCGSGKATKALAKRGFRILGIELGERLAEVARRTLSSYPNVGIVTSSFEEWDPGGKKFDLVYAATSWHWIDQEIRYSKAASLLKPRGHLAFWGASHAFPVGFDSFFTEIQDVYEAIGESYWRARPRQRGEPDERTWPPPPPEEVADEAEEIEETGLFDVVGIRRYVWAQEYDAEGYIALLETFSGHRAMSGAKRDFLYKEVRKRIELRPGAKLLRHWHSILHVARLRPEPGRASVHLNLGVALRDDHVRPRGSSRLPTQTVLEFHKHQWSRQAASYTAPSALLLERFR